VLPVTASLPEEIVALTKPPMRGVSAARVVVSAF
jgi:hypothetical protein